MKKKWKQWKQKFKNLSLKKKLLTFYSILFILPLLLISVIIYVEVSGSMLEKIRYSATQGYEQAKSYMEYKIVHLIQRTDVVVTNKDLKEMVSAGSAGQTGLHKQLEQREAIRSYLQSVESNNKNLQLEIYVPDKLAMMTDGDYILSLSQADEAGWYQVKGEQKIYFSPGIYLEDEKKDKFVALVRDIPEDNNYRARNCVLRMNISVEELEEILQNATPTENAVSYLVNRENIVVSVSNKEKFEALGMYENMPEAFYYSKYAESSEPGEEILNQKTVYCMRNKIRNTDWEMITVIPKADMTSGIARIQYIVAGLMILFGALTILGGTVIISWIVNRIGQLNDSFNQVKSGDMEVHLEDGSKDEIGVLYDNYNGMIARTRELMDEKYRMGVYLKSAELKALQSQINPHFLYNTLDMVNWLAYAGRTQDIHEAVISISQYYRLILNKGQDTLSLAEELQHVSYYIKIQDIRFPGRIHYEEKVDIGVKGSIVPKIILQPLVENAIQHGIWEKKSRSGTIRVLGFEERGIVFIKVIDDGVGMDSETLAHVLDGSLVTSGSSYGVKNVHARIQLMFGEEYGLSYESRQGEGTCVTIRFPRNAQESILPK